MVAAVVSQAFGWWWRACSNTTYEDIIPFILYKQYESWPHEMVPCFDQGLDEYFSKMELSRAEKAKSQTVRGLVMLRSSLAAM